jgi:CBS domain-containing protein
MKIREKMTQDPVTSNPDMDICQAVRRMEEFGFRRMPPVVERDKPAGIISVVDIAEHAKPRVATYALKASWERPAKLCCEVGAR